VSVYSSHIQNVDLLNSNTGRFLTKMSSKKWYFLPLGWHNCDQCLGAVPSSVCQDRSKCNESAGSQNWFCQSLCQLALQSAHKQTMVFWHNWRSKQRHSVSSLTTRYVWTHTDGHLALMEGQENMQTARPQCGVHTSCHVKNVNWILASKQTIFFFHWH